MRMSTIKTKKSLKNFIVYVVLTFAALCMAIPYVWMIVTSVKPIEEIQTYPPSFTVHNPTLQPYRELFSLLSMGRYLFNSLFITNYI